MNYIKPRSLKYSFKDLEPFLSENMLSFHYKSLYCMYVKTFNKALKNRFTSIVHVIKSNTFLGSHIKYIALQIYNHNFYWKSMINPRMSIISYFVKQIIIDNFCSIEIFKFLFFQNCLSVFGNGWVWLAKVNNKLIIICTKNSDSLINTIYKPVLVCDIWEHSYNIDYKSSKLKYLQAWWNVINWDEVGREC